MEWALGNILSFRTIAIGCAVVTVASTLAIARPKAIPLPHFSFSFGSTAPAHAGGTDTIVISRADAANASAVVSSIDDVHSQADVAAYADFLMQNDAHITEIQVGEHSVSMSYETRNRILNVRTVADQTKASVKDNGTVTVSGSWYRPLFSHVAQASSPDAGFSDIAMTSDGSGLSAVTEARILARLHGRFQIGALQ